MGYVFSIVCVHSSFTHAIKQFIRIDVTLCTGLYNLDFSDFIVTNFPYYKSFEAGFTHG